MVFNKKIMAKFDGADCEGGGGRVTCYSLVPQTGKYVSPGKQ